MPFYVLEIVVVPLAGLEPAHLAVPDFESPLILLHSYSQLLTSHLQRLEIMEVFKTQLLITLQLCSCKIIGVAFTMHLLGEKLCHGND